MTVSPIIIDMTESEPMIIDLSVPCEPVDVVEPTAQAGFGAAGMLLIAGLGIGAVFFMQNCSKHTTKEECEKNGCKWENGKCVKA